MLNVIELTGQMQLMVFAQKNDDDFSDRLNHRFTVGLLILFCIVILTRQYGSDVNIKCWTPAHFTSNYEQYVSQICWISNTYHIDKNESIPKEEVKRRQGEIKYYQWVIFILLFQAFIFYIPRIIWRTMSLRSGLSLPSLIDAANNYRSVDKFDSRGKYMKYMVTIIDQYVDDQRRYDDNRPINRVKKLLMLSMPCAGRFLGNYIVILYFVVKFIYIINAALQVFILSGILGQNFVRFGFDFMDSLARGRGWTVESKYFPKVSLCDFTIRELGNPNRSHVYTVQCVLPINLFNQQIFIVIWFWYFLVFCFNISGLIKWILRCVPQKSSKWIRKRVLLNEQIKATIDPRTFDHFTDYYLEADGMFMVRMIANNTNDFVATDLIHELWKKHCDKYKDWISMRRRSSVKKKIKFASSASLATVNEEILKTNDRVKFYRSVSEIYT